MGKDSRLDLSVIIPMYNEEENVAETVRQKAMRTPDQAEVVK